MYSHGNEQEGRKQVAATALPGRGVEDRERRSAELVLAGNAKVTTGVRMDAQRPRLLSKEERDALRADLKETIRKLREE